MRSRTHHYLYMFFVLALAALGLHQLWRGPDTDMIPLIVIVTLAFVCVMEIQHRNELEEFTYKTLDLIDELIAATKVATGKDDVL